VLSLALADLGIRFFAYLADDSRNLNSCYKRKSISQDIDAFLDIGKTSITWLLYMVQPKSRRFG